MLINSDIKIICAEDKNAVDVPETYFVVWSNDYPLSVFSTETDAKIYATRYLFSQERFPMSIFAVTSKMVYVDTFLFDVLERKEDWRDAW